MEILIKIIQYAVVFAIFFPLIGSGLVKSDDGLLFFSVIGAVLGVWFSLWVADGEKRDAEKEEEEKRAAEKRRAKERRARAAKKRAAEKRIEEEKRKENEIRQYLKDITK